MPKVKVATLRQSPYAFSGQGRVDPTRQGIELAIKEGRYSKSIMDQDYQIVAYTILQQSRDPVEMDRLMREYHNERVAELIRTKDSWLGVSDTWPIKINQFNQVVEGNHRFRAVRFLEIDEIEVVVVEEACPRPTYSLPEIW